MPPSARPSTGHAPSSYLARWARSLLRPVDGAGLAVVRVAFGLIVVWEVWRYVERGWIARYYLAPDVQFTYLFFPWVRAWPGDGMMVHFALLALAGALLAIGAWYRVAAWAVFVLLTYVFLLEQSRYLNHVYLMCLLAFLLAVVPAHRTWSFDAWRTGRDRPVPAWSVTIVRFQVGAMYVFAALAKVNPDWLAGMPMDRWLRSRGDLPVIGPLTRLPDAHLLFSYGGLAIDLVAVPALLWRRSRPYAFALLVAFHLANDQMFSIGVFPALAIAATTAFFDHDWPRRALARLGGRVPARPAVPRAARRRAPGVGERVALALVVLFALTHLALPLRHHLYPSDVAWSEEGHRFAWRMMLRSKRGEVRFAVVSPAGGTWMVDARDLLEPFQVGQATTRPDMILQLAHHLARRYAAEGHPDVTVHAIAYVRLNGREPQLLIDPLVDLARERRTWRPASWILPLAPGGPQPAVVASNSGS
jgi:vitamin K-dependent gamma-carboxylase